MDEPKYCFVQFKFTFATVFGEDIRVIGNIPELGNVDYFIIGCWDVKTCEKMVTSQLDFPVWKTKENIKVKQNTEINYKYLIFRNGKFDKWEYLPNNANRVINVRNNIRIVIHDIQGISSSRIEKITKLNFNIESSPINDGTYEEEEEQCFYTRDSKPRRSYYYEKNLDFLLNYDDHKQKKNLNSIKNHPEEEEKFQDLNYESEEEDDVITDKNIKEEKEVKQDDKIIMGVLYLPMMAIKNEKGEWELALTNDPFFNNIFKILEGRTNVIWVGLLKNYSLITNENDRGTLISTLQKKYNMYTIKIDPVLETRLRKFLYGVLDPLFQYITIFNNMKEILEFEDLWKAYKDFNELVSKSILSHITENTLVFLHDYHLLLTPSFLFNAHHHFNSKIYSNILLGLYVHSPFPSHDVLRMFPYREELLKSMMNCSLIGFHTFDSSRNFLTSCKRIIYIQYESNKKGDLALSYYGRNVIVRVKHVCSEQNLIEQEIKNSLFKKRYNEIKGNHPNQFINVSVDNLLFLPGIKHKIEAYKRFLREIGDSNARQIALVIYINTTKEDNFEVEGDLFYKALLEQILENAQSIRKEFGDEVIDIVVKDIPYTERLAVLASGNCFVKTCKRESFSLDIYEFLNLKILMKDTDKISYILSENSGVTTSFSGGVKVNSFDIHSIVKGFLCASQIQFDNFQLSNSQEKDLLHVKKNSISDWFFSFLRGLKNANDCDDNYYYLGAGIGLNFRLMKISSNFKELNRKSIINDYDHSKKRLILLDYEGTLPSASSANTEYLAKGQNPHPKILNVLEYLTMDKRNTIFIVTGREAKLVSEWFSVVSNLGLASEHGFLYRYSSENKSKDTWERMISNFNIEWRGFTVEHLEPYTERCEGSFIETKEASVVWQYRDCDPELGKSFANVITLDLESILRNLNLSIINGKGYVEVKPKGINKGAFLSFIIKEEIKRGKTPDFIMTVGDDTADEEMFQFLKKKKNTIKNYSKNLKTYSITVGKKPSSADSYVDTPNDIRNLLEMFMQCSLKKRLSNSTFDVKNLSTLNESTTGEHNSSSSNDRLGLHHFEDAISDI